MKDLDFETLWNSTSRVAPSAKSPRQTFHEGKCHCNILMYLQEKAHSNTCPWILSQTYPGQRALTAYLRLSIKGAPKQPNSFPATRRLMDQVWPKNTSNT